MEKSVSASGSKAFLAHLRNVRKGAGVTQVELAVRLGETQSFVSKIERGERRIDVLELRAWCEALGVSFPEFVKTLDEILRMPFGKRSSSQRTRSTK